MSSQYDAGYEDGHKTGYQAGHLEGYQAGHLEGYQAGYNQALDDNDILYGEDACRFLEAAFRPLTDEEKERVGKRHEAAVELFNSTKIKK